MQPIVHLEPQLPMRAMGLVGKAGRTSYLGLIFEARRRATDGNDKNG